MTGKERMTRILKRQKTDRIGLYEHFWGDTCKKWVEQGYLKEYVSPYDLFDYDNMNYGYFNLVADLDFKNEVVEETEETIVVRDGNGVTLRHHKLHDTTPEHIHFDVQCADDYYRRIKPLLVPSERRFKTGPYLEAKNGAAAKDRFYCHSITNVFEHMQMLCGHENLLVGMALEPEWVAGMAMDYAKLIVSLQEMLFARCGKPDGVFFYEDMGFKHRPFMSPAMYKALIFPAHKYTIDYAKSLGLPVIMHSCGFVEPLLPGMIEAGIDMLQVIEVKAGMDLLRIYKTYGDRLSLMGGIDVRTLYSNDKDIIRAELEAKLPIVKQGFGYVLHSDHSIPDTVSFDSYKFFVELGMEIGRLD